MRAGAAASATVLVAGPAQRPSSLLRNRHSNLGWSAGGLCRVVRRRGSSLQLESHGLRDDDGHGCNAGLPRGQGRGDRGYGDQHDVSNVGEHPTPILEVLHIGRFQQLPVCEDDLDKEGAEAEDAQPPQFE